MQAPLFKRIPPKLFEPMLWMVLFCSLCTGVQSCSAQKIDTLELKDRIRNVLEFETAEFVYRDLVYRALGSNFLGLTTRDTRVLAEVKLRVIAGIDIREGLDISVIEEPESGPILEVRIPHAKILVVDADESTIKQFMLQEFGFINDGRISLLEFTDQLQENKKTITADALKRGILERAETNARQVISNLLSLAGYPQVHVVFFETPGLETVDELPIQDKKK